ncbi:glycosyltransferase involved in cell wall biosynthesis [Motilibacter rhizosphaerae]|uniref:Glycosyltransferase involved in cell wall biosynthesis n=1 Tax=Motilibacter rhizosphaerae TaxID=598652 RepID=A0A4Q7NYP8_9ACTN|nr:glycosyltransferase family 4 protein [Motilibacter rhizosphaerae]RZS91532.1 glycosyltransferase involved in cell wall biosynthesis [Motilibacter rhizosphaerae]
MRTALLTGRFAPRHDGVADYVARLRDALAEQGAEPLVVSARGSEGADAEVCDRFDLRGVREAARALDRLAPDVVHVQFAPSAYSFSPWVGLLPALVSRPVVTTLHEYGWWTGLPRVPAPVWGALEPRVDRETLLLGPRSAELLATNAGHAAQVRERLGRTPRLVPIGPNVRASALSRDEARAAVTARWGVPPAADLLVFFGFVHPVKGVRYLLEGLATVRAELGRDVRLVVAGGFESLALPGQEATDFRAELVAHAASCGVTGAVVFTDHVPEDEVATLLRASDAVVLPLTAGVTSKSGALLAALDSGCCTVATLPDSSTDGVAEVVAPIAARRDGAAVADALSRVLLDEDLRADLRCRALARAAEHSWASIAERHLEAYRAVLGP